MANLKTPTASHGILDNAERQYKALKKHLTQQVSFLDAEVDANMIISTVRFMASCVEIFQKAVDSADVLQIAKNKHHDPDYDVQAGLTTLINKINSTAAGVMTLVPTTDGYVSIQYLDADGKLAWRKFPTSMTSTFKADLIQIIAMIE